MNPAIDVRSLRAELAAGGVFKRRTASSWVKFLAMLGALAAFIVAVVLLPWWCALFLVPLAAVPAATAAMIGHEAGHGSFAVSRSHNELMLHLAFPLFTGMSALRWKHKHNRQHHTSPNVVSKDADLDQWPMALSSVAHIESGRFRRWWQRHLQGYMFWPITSLMAFVIRYETVFFLAAHARARGVDRPWIHDLGCLIAHYVLWLLIPSLIFGPVPVLLFYLGLWAVVGLLLALVFAPSHMGLPIVSAASDRWRHQLDTTRDLLVPRWLSWFFVGLDYQVEHHLFPAIPHQHMPRAREITRAWCERVGVPHQQIGYAAGVADVTRFMFQSWRLAPVDMALAPVSGPGSYRSPEPRR